MDCPADVMCIFLCGHVILSSFSFYSLLSSFWFPLMQSQMRTLGGGADWKCVCVCVCVCVCEWVSESSPCEWVVDDDPLLSALYVCVGWPRPLDIYLWGSIPRWIEPPLCFTAGLSRTLHSQCMIHYPIRGRVTHPWVILSNPGAHVQPSRCSLY